ncbi:MAG: hypothetical protein KF812_11890 [Fimbriimonadaceae bacterium]|nr:hypothetical protein [Fimbriimonadaceae bacterium]
MTVAKSVEQIKSSLKLRTEPKANSLTLRIGVKKYVLPFEARMIQNDDMLFVHIPPAAEIFKIAGGKLNVVDSVDGATAAAKALRRPRGPKRKSAQKSVEMSGEVAKALAAIPAGYKIGYDAKGNARLVRMRTRRKKK